MSNRHRRLDYSPSSYTVHPTRARHQPMVAWDVWDQSTTDPVTRKCPRWPGRPNITCDASRIRCQGHIMGAWARHPVVTARAWENSEQVALTGCVPGKIRCKSVAMIHFPPLLVKLKYISSGKWQRTENIQYLSKVKDVKWKNVIVLLSAINALQPLLIGDLDCLRVSRSVHDWSNDINGGTFIQPKQVNSYLSLQYSWMGLSSSVSSPWILSV